LRKKAELRRIHSHTSGTDFAFSRAAGSCDLDGTPVPWQDFLRADSNLARFIFLWNAVTFSVFARASPVFLCRSGFLLLLRPFHWRFHWFIT